MANEKKTDIIIANMMKDAGIKATPNDSDVIEIHDALKTASKRGTGHNGYPEFVAVVNDFVIVVEDKADNSKQAKFVDPNNPKALLMDRDSVTDYAENGAVFYARHIVEHTHFKKVFAFGCSGSESGRLIIRPIFVSPKMVLLLNRVQNFNEFNAEHINAYYKKRVLGNKPVEQVELEQIISRASMLHEDLRNYGNLGDTEKPLVVSALLLALANTGFSTSMLNGSQENGCTDGEKVYLYLSDYMDRVHVEPQVKKDRVLAQFLIVKNRPILSQVNEHLGKTPLRYFAEYLDSNVLTAIRNNHPEDVLGRFYGEFMSYSGGDGQSLGVVLTPKHITELFCELVDLKPTDKVLDPCCGTGGFLIAALSSMLNQVDEKCCKGEITERERSNMRTDIRKNCLYGFELRDDMFSIATTNMILRGDGKSNLLCDDFLAQSSSELQQHGCSVGLMNPPYSQAKNKVTAHLSELRFICHLLDSLAPGARCAVIVPQSTMVGKSKQDKADKRYILDKHTLEGVITLNPQTFYGVGTNPVIAIFTAHQPHPERKYARFIDFKDDGYDVYPHIGLLPTPKAKQRHDLLLDCWLHNRPAPNDFMVLSTVEADDEWLHSFYYFNESIPTEADFEKTMADYLAFEFSMIVHGRGYLFESEEDDKRYLNKHIKEEKDNNPCLENRRWEEFYIGDIFPDIIRGKRLKTDDHIAGTMPYVSSSSQSNGVDNFVSNTDGVRIFTNCLSLANSGSVGETFYHQYDFVASDHVTKLANKSLDKFAYLFISSIVRRLAEKYSFNREINDRRLKREKIMLPVTSSSAPDYAFMSKFMQTIELKQLKAYINQRMDSDC
ncbi:MAG: N-6 DNA methylase [Bacteroidales bacterium]|nr:N-6 DNA methylase [Bacteroidales bacterium]